MRKLMPWTLVALAIALPLGAQSAADGSTDDPSSDGLAGSWTFEQETPRGTMTHTLTFAIEDGAWVGTMVNERRSFELEEVVLEDGQLTFSLPMGPPPGRGGQGRQGGRQGQSRQQSGGEDASPSRGGDGERPSAVFQGVLDGDAITGELEGPRGRTEVVLTRTEG